MLRASAVGGGRRQVRQFNCSSGRSDFRPTPCMVWGITMMPWKPLTAPNTGGLLPILAVAMLAACGSTPTAELSNAVSGAVSTMAPEEVSERHLGFDTYGYPGDAAMTAWRDESVPYEWVGYYLPAPCHKDASWSGKRQKLTDMGWGLAVIYVGQQTWGGTPGKPQVRTKYVTKYVTQTVRVKGKRVKRRVPKKIPVRVVVEPRARSGSSCNKELVSESRGDADGADAIAKAEAEGFPHGTTIFLDIERMDFVPTRMRDYYKAWTKHVVEDGRYRPGYYAHKANAQLIYNDAIGVYALAGKSGKPAFWISGGSGFSPEESEPADVGHAFANVWQGVLDVARTHNGIALPIDINVAKFPSPSASQNTD